MKLTTTTQISVDGVVQANGKSVENGSRVLERGGWARPLFDSEAIPFVNEVYQRADAFPFGRRTYELFAGYWGVRKDLEDPIVGALILQLEGGALVCDRVCHSWLVSGYEKNGDNHFVVTTPRESEVGRT